MIQAFRSNLAKKITVVLFALLMLIFLLTSVDLTAIGGGGGPVGKINGERVDARNYELAVQQVVYTLQAAAGERLPVWMRLEGQRGSAPYTAAPQSEALSQVSISDPPENASAEMSVAS